MITDSAKTATDKHNEKLIKQKSISRDEAKRMFKCKFCQIDGYFKIDCRKKKSASKDNSSDKDKSAKDKDTKKSKSVLQLQPILIPRTSPMNLEPMLLM